MLEKHRELVIAGIISSVVVMFWNSWLIGGLERRLAQLEKWPHEKFVGNRGAQDGASVPVQSCLETMANLQGISSLKGFTGWVLQGGKGGSYQLRNQEELAKFCWEKRVPVPAYAESSSADFVFRASKLGLPVMVTDKGGAESPYKCRVYTACVVMGTNDTAVILWDPNFVEDFQLLTHDQFRRRFDGWALAFTNGLDL